MEVNVLTDDKKKSKIMKKMISTVTVFALLLCALSPMAYAVNTQSKKQTFHRELECISQLDIKTEYRMDHGDIVYAKVTSGTDVVERFGDEIFLNGQEFATLDIVNTSNYVEPRTGWIASETGTKSDYNDLMYENEKKSLAFRESLLDLGVDGIYLVLLTITPVNTLALAIARGVQEFVAANIGYGNAKTMYYTETRYKHDYISFSQMTERKYYIDSAYTLFVGDETLFWAWG